MASIFYEVKAFLNPLPNGLVSPADGRHRAPMTRLAWAAATVGANPFGPRLGRRERALEMQWRMAMIRAAVLPGPRYFYRSRSYARLAPSEKGAVSFFLGQAQAKLFAHDFFRISKFVAYDHYLEHLKSPRARTRPDFLGFRGTQTAITVEAKGRSGGYPASLIEDAKEQAESIPPIAGYPQPTTYVHLAYFWGDEWCAYLEDPPQRPNVQDGPPVSPETLTLAYYHPIVAAVRTRRADEVQIDGVAYIRTSFEDVDSSLLVRADIVDQMPQDDEISTDPDRLRLASEPLYTLGLALDRRGSTATDQEIGADLDDDENSPRFIGDDGVGVELGASWLERRPADDE